MSDQERYERGILEKAEVVRLADQRARQARFAVYDMQCRSDDDGITSIMRSLAVSDLARADANLRAAQRELVKVITARDRGAVEVQPRV